MKTMTAVGALVLAVVVFASVGGCKSKEPGGQSKATAEQDAAAKALGIPNELILDLGNNVTMKLVLIPSGKFTMGSPTEETGRFDNEVQHDVTISKPLYMGVFPVTQEQYVQIMGTNPSEFKAPRNPVETVSWDDAVEFCTKLSLKTCQTVRLPTEAQWEYACRAGTTTRFNFGDKDEDLWDYAWYSKNSENRTHPVGQKKPNNFGLYDMHGNVWQWCADWLNNDYLNAPMTMPEGRKARALRVLRGGSWQTVNLQNCRSAYRGGNDPTGKYDGFGFRVVVDLQNSATSASLPAGRGRG